MPDVIAEALDNPVIPTIGLALAGAGVALWLAAAWWAYADATRRTDSTLAGLVVAGWVVLSTPLLLPFSLAIYALARPQQTAAEHRTRDLAGELVNFAEVFGGSRCSMCASAVDPEWLRCPACSTWLSLPCATCGRWSEKGLASCPWCGSEERAAPAVEQFTPAGSPRPVRARRRRTVRATSGAGPAARPGQRRLVATDGRPLSSARSR
jgi:hypothetical protein